MKLKITDNKNIELEGKKYILTDTLTTSEILTALRRGVLSTTSGNIVSEDTTEIKKTGSKTFTLNGDSYTLDKERSEEQLLRDLSNKGFVKLSSGDFVNTAGTGSGETITTSGTGLTRIKFYQNKYVKTAGARTNSSADTGIATSNTAIDLLSLFFIGNYKDFIIKNRDNLEIAFLVGDRRSSIDRVEWSDYFDFNSLTTETSILLDLKGQEYDFKAQLDNNLNLKITDKHVGQANFFGATFGVSLRWKS